MTALVEQKDAEIADLKKQLELIRTLRVEMPNQTLSLPETMHIEQATVGQLHTPALAHPRVVESGVTSPKLPLSATSSASSSSVPINEAKLKALQVWFERKTKPHQRRMLKVLHGQGKPMDVYEIASWSGDAESLLRNQPPLVLVQRGMLSRTMVYRKGYRYTSTLTTFLAKEFPDADQQALVAQVLSWCD